MWMQHKTGRRHSSWFEGLMTNMLAIDLAQIEILIRDLYRLKDVRVSSEALAWRRRLVSEWAKNDIMPHEEAAQKPGRWEREAGKIIAEAPPIPRMRTLSLLTAIGCILRIQTGNAYFEGRISWLT